MKALKVLVVLLFATLLAACSGSKRPDDHDVNSRNAKSHTDQNASIYPWEDPNNPLYNRIIYFDYDKSDVKEEGRTTIATHAKFLAANPNQRVRLEGHADERGSREYNIGLGERRSQAVRRLMVFQGVADHQIETISYGEEKPAVDGHDESAWAQNRRVEIRYVK